MSSQNPAKILPRVSAHQERWQLVCEWKWLLGFLLCLSSAQSASRLSGSAWCSAGASDKSGWLTASSVERGLHFEGFSQCVSCDSQARLRISTWVAGNLQEKKKKRGCFYLRNKLPLCSSGRLVFLGFRLGFEADVGLRLVCAEQGALWHSSSRGAGGVRAVGNWPSSHCAPVWVVEEQSQLVFTAFLVWKPVQWPYTLLRWRYSFVVFFSPAVFIAVGYSL